MPLLKFRRTGHLSNHTPFIVVRSKYRRGSGRTRRGPTGGQQGRSGTKGGRGEIVNKRTRSRKKVLPYRTQGHGS